MSMHDTVLVQRMASSSTSHVSVSESTDSEQPTESCDLPSTASSSMPSARPISQTNLIDCLHALQKSAQYDDRLSTFLSISDNFLSISGPIFEQCGIA